MRTDEFMGVSPAAVDFLKENRQVCPHCNCNPPCSVEIAGHYLGMYHSEHPLFSYKLKDGTKAVQFHQASPWSSGPIHFLGLRLEDGTEFTWAEEEIMEAI